MHDHKFSLGDIDEMIPWERDIYLILLKEWIKEEKSRIEEQKRKSSSKRRTFKKWYSIKKYINSLGKNSTIFCGAFL